MDVSSEKDNNDSNDVYDAQLDITDIIKDCAENCLSVQNPFLSDPETFNLHDAMAASQLMDPKMDCCEVPAKLIAPWRTTDDDDRYVFPRPIPSGLDDPISPLPWSNLTLQQASCISLEILVRLQSLLSGSSVGESTFTCLYAHSGVLADMRTRLVPSSGDDTIESSFQKLKVSEDDSSTLAQWSVFAATLALVEMTEGVRQIILNADIYEEEDFAFNTHNLVFYTTNNTTAIMEGPPKESNSSRLDTASVLQQVLQRLEQCGPEAEPIKLVLKFQFHLLVACSTLSHLSCQSLHEMIHSCQQNVRLAVTALKQLKNQHVDNISSPGSDIILQQTFDSFVNRPLVGNVPLRKVCFQTPDKAIDILIQITSELEDCVCNLMLRGNSLGRIQRMLDRVSNANILSRSLLLLNLYFDEKLLGQHDLQTFIKEHMLQLQSPGSINPFITKDVQAFLNRLAKPLYDTLKLRLLNRNRQRAFIESVLLVDWSVLQNESQIVDYHLNNQSQQGAADQQQQQTTTTYFTRFVLTVVTRLMDRYIESGVVVGLVQNNHHDLSFNLWYRDFLLSALNQNLALMRQSKDMEHLNNSNNESQTTPAASSSAKSKGGKKKHHKHKTNGKHNVNKTKNAAEPAKKSPYDLEDIFELTMIALKRNLCRKTIQFLAALTQAGILKEKRFEFTSLERIFEKRFDVFSTIRQPPPLTYAHYVEGNNFSRISAENLIHSVTEGFQYCRSSIDQLLKELQALEDPIYAAAMEPELRALLKICIGNSVYVQKLRQLVQSGESRSQADVTFDFDTHKEFCIIKIS